MLLLNRMSSDNLILRILKQMREEAIVEEERERGRGRKWESESERV